MNQKEWLEYFELVNGRKPSPAEMAQAKAEGEYQEFDAKEVVSAAPQVPQESVSPALAAQSEQAYGSNPVVANGQGLAVTKGLSKRSKIILIAVLGSLAGLFLIIGGYALVRYQSGKITDGIYEVVAYSYYDEDEDEMVDAIKEFDDEGVEVKDFLVVENNQSQHFNYYDSGEDEQISLFESNSKVTQTFDPWNRTQRQTLTTSEYRDLMTDLTADLQDDYSFYTDSSAKRDINNAVSSFKDSLKERRIYVKNGNTFTLSMYNEDGELQTRITYCRMAQDKARDRQEDYNAAVQDLKDEMKETSDIYDSYIDGDYGYDYGYSYGDYYDSDSSNRDTI